jgi:hypothetical protein
LPELIYQLAPVVSAMIEQVEQHLVNRLLEYFTLGVVVLKHMLQYMFLRTNDPFMPLPVELLQLLGSQAGVAGKLITGDGKPFL